MGILRIQQNVINKHKKQQQEISISNLKPKIKIKFINKLQRKQQQQDQEQQQTQQQQLQEQQQIQQQLDEQQLQKLYGRYKWDQDFQINRNHPIQTFLMVCSRTFTLQTNLTYFHSAIQFWDILRQLGLQQQVKNLSNERGNDENQKYEDGSFKHKRFTHWLR